jgi:hypothetical protein
MDIASPAVTPGRIAALAALAAAALIAAGCSSNSGSTAVTKTPLTQSSAAQPVASAAPAGTESPPPGDIPDSTVYIPFQPASNQYLVKVPEGWARTVTSSAVSFTDKLNSVMIQTVRAPAPTLASARATEVPRIQGTVRHFALIGVGSVNRSAGSAILVRYSADSQPDPVTGKVYKNTFERYEFYRNGVEAVVTLSGPAGADNVDPWRTVTSSFRWLR